MWRAENTPHLCNLDAVRSWESAMWISWCHQKWSVWFKISLKTPWGGKKSKKKRLQSLIFWLESKLGARGRWNAQDWKKSHWETRMVKKAPLTETSPELTLYHGLIWIHSISCLFHFLKKVCSMFFFFFCIINHVSAYEALYSLYALKYLLETPLNLGYDIEQT